MQSCFQDAACSVCFLLHQHLLNALSCISLCMILLFSVAGPSSPPVSPFAASYPSVHTGSSSSPTFVSVSGASPEAFSGRNRARCPPAAAPRRDPWTRDSPKPVSGRVPLWRKGLEPSRPCENLGVDASDHFWWLLPSLGFVPRL